MPVVKALFCEAVKHRSWRPQRSCMAKGAEVGVAHAEGVPEQGIHRTYYTGHAKDFAVDFRKGRKTRRTYEAPGGFLRTYFLKKKYFNIWK